MNGNVNKAPSPVTKYIASEFNQLKKKHSLTINSMVKIKKFIKFDKNKTIIA